MVRQISRVAQTIICPFPFEHEACLDSTEKQNSNAMGARIQGSKNSRSRSISGQTTRSRQRRGEEALSKRPPADRRFSNSRVLEFFAASLHSRKALGASKHDSQATVNLPETMFTLRSRQDLVSIK